MIARLQTLEDLAPMAGLGRQEIVVAQHMVRCGIFRRLRSLSGHYVELNLMVDCGLLDRAFGGLCQFGKFDRRHDGRILAICDKAPLGITTKDTLDQADRCVGFACAFDVQFSDFGIISC